MLWTLPGSMRSLAHVTHRRFTSTNASLRALEPLRILFCGADEFSIASLRAVVATQRHVPGLIQDIHVLHRPAKPTGRGLKTLREVPIKRVATEELSLPTHAVDTFTGWTPPIPISLVIAVSFGLLVPPRILRHAQYGGLNVHPSLLPDLHGPAPIEHAIIKGREYTGVTVQTLHPQHFDQGTILAQTPHPGVAVPHGTTARELERQLAKAGAELLVHVLKSRKFVPPHEPAGWYATSNGPVSHAPKTTKQDRFVDFGQDTLAEILAKLHAFGDPWCTLPNGDRLILHDIVDTGITDAAQRAPGIFIEPTLTARPDLLLIRAACGKVASLKKSTYEGKKHGSGNEKLLRLLAPRNQSLYGYHMKEGLETITVTIYTEKRKSNEIGLKPEALGVT
ncbi:hypothetical protein PTNB73_08767 [Pyrenophora teres f. teres]|nr:hypothetical protein HRS9139_08881 [Pyrenophora teres f. teres]KAE8834868.1 hypothetical protein PTNB85_06201 [Pyrenophora teres f. teres]KAE8859287.1 hypothetical protein PTNB73_08767 [Pyrenophora teres f. teres]CAA9964111.1 Methionyl-tRNAmyltransferase [Pyrenophora teres f. maculata]